MATNPKNADRDAKLSVEELRRALLECRDQLGHIEKLLRQCRQDNEPPDRPEAR